MKATKFLVRVCSTVSASALSVAANAQTAPSDPAATVSATAPTATAAPTAVTPQATSAAPSDTPAVGDIIVTAQKREQSINNVGMSITAVSGAALTERGVFNTEDLVKVVPGLVVTSSLIQTPVYTIRGIGFFDSSLASSPAVTVYVDEVPLVSPLMTSGASLDVERVEVLKGPQGTLFGQNSTGGAINYIAAKPTSTLQAGGTVSVERFGLVDGTAYISGPVTDNLRVRLSARTVQGGEWQYSQTRPDDKLGNQRKYFGRLLLDWNPSDRLKVSLNVNGFHDTSDTQGFQLTTKAILNPAFARPILTDAPFAPDKARAADWGVNNPMRFNTRFWQASGRVDYDLTDTIVLTSLTSYSDLHIGTFNDGDGTAAQIVDNHQVGYFKSAAEELRIAGSSDRINWIVGANYQRDRALDATQVSITDNTLSFPVQGIPGFQSVPQIAEAIGRTRQKINNEAAFGNVEYKLTDALTLQGGLRYTRSSRRGNSCSYDALPSNATGQNFEALQQLFLAIGLKQTPFVPIAPFQCYEFDAGFSPDLDGFDQKLTEHNLSIRAGVTYKFSGGLLAYANFGRGFKAGAIPALNASADSEFIAAVQERVDAYEAGIKAPLFGRRVHLNAAGFYYDYKNKQIRGAVLDPIFGTLERLINVPKSRVWGVDADLTAQPMRGLTVTGGATFINTKVLGSFPSINRAGISADYAGSRLPFSPGVTGNGDVQYEWALASGTKPFLGASVVFHSKDNSTFRTAAAPARPFDIKGYATLDLRAGLAAADDSWRVMLFGRNVTNKFYWVGATQSSDTFTRTAARPVTYGISLSLRTR